MWREAGGGGGEKLFKTKEHKVYLLVVDVYFFFFICPALRGHSPEHNPPAHLLPQLGPTTV